MILEVQSYHWTFQFSIPLSTWLEVSKFSTLFWSPNAICLLCMVQDVSDFQSATLPALLPVFSSATGDTLLLLVKHAGLLINKVLVPTLNCCHFLRCINLVEMLSCKKLNPHYEMIKPLWFWDASFSSAGQIATWQWYSKELKLWPLICTNVMIYSQRIHVVVLCHLKKTVVWWVPEFLSYACILFFLSSQPFLIVILLFVGSYIKMCFVW